jgi:hypothetical protein
MKSPINVLLFVALLFAGCASPYSSTGLTGGFRESDLGNGKFLVSYQGNAYTSEQKAADFAQLRAAELCLENGYKYFKILHMDRESVKTAEYTQKNERWGDRTTVQRKPNANCAVIGFQERVPGDCFETAPFVAGLKKAYNLD